MLPNIQEWSNPTLSEFSGAIGRATAVLISQEKEGAIAGGRISGAFCEVAELDNVVVISDLHGDFECLARILEEVDYERFLRDETNKIVFLGDYVDRGANSVGVLHTVCQLKSRFPNSIILMRGNHEAPSEFPFSSHDFPFQLVERFGEDSGRTAYRKALLFFKELTVATTIQRELLLVHGGLPTNVEGLRDYRSLLASAYENHTSNRIFAELLWNDPRQIESAADWEDSRRGIGRHFGARITKEWLRATGTKCVVRGHEPCQGFRIDHDGGVFTLFSCMRPYPAFKAAYLSISAKDLGNVRNASDLVPFVRFPRLL